MKLCNTVKTPEGVHREDHAVIRRAASAGRAVKIAVEAVDQAISGVCCRWGR